MGMVNAVDVAQLIADLTGQMAHHTIALDR